MTVIAALLIASCLFPEDAPPAESKSLLASCIAKLIKSEEELDPEPEPEPPDVNFFIA